jgi:hypothetical protein
MGLLFAGAAGIVLAASAGLRAFMPLLGLGLAARLLDWPIAPSMAWLATDAGLLGLGIAALVELAADKIPVVDHLLDLIHTVVGPLAGALVAFSAWGDFPSAAALILALALGAPVAGGIHAVAAATRLKSTVASGGTLNPAVSIAEDGVSIGAIAVAVLVPVLALLVALGIVFFIIRLLVRRVRRRSAAVS